MRRLSLFAFAAATLLGATATAASAGGGAPFVSTQTIAGTAVNFFSGPCPGTDGVVTTVFHDVFHITIFADGHGTIVTNQEGSFSFVPTDPLAPTSSGRYRNGFSNTFENNSGTFTTVFLAVGRDTNGAPVKFKVSTHFTFANGEVRVDNTTVACG